MLNQNNEKIVAYEQWRVMQQLQTEKPLAEMAKIWITNERLVKAAQTRSPIKEWLAHQATVASRGTPMDQ